MWWLDPGKEILNVLFNRILAPYVENLDLNQVNYGIGQGQISLHNLRLKKGALDKFSLPVDVMHGHLGKFTLSLHWFNLGNQPVEILIEDVYLLVVPSPQEDIDLEEEERRAQAAKAERLEDAELLHIRNEPGVVDSSQPQGLWESLLNKIINNIQVTVKNIHIRYEDQVSVPEHPFCAGITLAGFNAFSVDELWKPAFIESTAGAIHKLSNLQSLAIYFDTHATTLSGLSASEAIQQLAEMVALGSKAAGHQFILRPVSGEGKITVNHHFDANTPRFDVQLSFDEIGVVLDDNQYRDVISLLDMYHVYLRRRQYRKYRPRDFGLSPAKARLQFAATAVLEGVQERRRKWTWDYFAERRNDRVRYVELYQRKLLSTLSGVDLGDFEALEKKLSYDDIRFYRSIGRSRLRKDTALRQRLEAEKEQQRSKQSWSSWLWGSRSEEDANAFKPMTEEQRKELYDVLDYDEKAALTESLQTPRDSLKARISAKLHQGSFTLRTDPHGTDQNIISIVFDVLRADYIQRPENFEISLSVGGFGVKDGITVDSRFPDIVRLQDETQGMQITGLEASQSSKLSAEPFFFVKFENNPLDERADTALTLRMRHMEIVYHRGYVEAIYKFFKPPASQVESIEALLSAASQTLEGLRKETRAGLEYALQTHKTIDIQMDLNAPVIIIPEDVTSHDCTYLIIDAGHISIVSHVANKESVRTIQAKRKQKYTDEDYEYLESLMYDKQSLRLEAAQFIIGDNLDSCLDALYVGSSDSLHLLEKINIDLELQNSIVPSVLRLPRFKLAAKLPSLRVNFSDSKYKSLLRLIDVCIPKFGEEGETSTVAPPEGTVPGFQIPASLFGSSGTEYSIGEDSDEDNKSVSNETESPDGEDVFFEVGDGSAQWPELHQQLVVIDFQVDDLGASISKTVNSSSEKVLGKISFGRFMLQFSMAKYDMKVLVSLRSLSLDLDQPGTDRALKFLSSAEIEPMTAESPDLMTVTYVRAQRQSPEFETIFENIDQNVDIKFSAFIFRAAPEPIISFYDFVMATFTTNPARTQQISGQASQQQEVPRDQSADGRIRVVIKLAQVQVVLSNEDARLATLSLSTADTTLLLRPRSMRITGKLGSLALSNDARKHCIREEFTQIISIEGQNLAEFRYETFDPTDDNYMGIKSSMFLSAASVKLHYLEEPLHDIYLFFSKLAKLKGLYDAATQAAVEQASRIERMQFEISVKTPILIFPSNPAQSPDVLVLRLGQMNSRNESQETLNKIYATLTGIQLVSEFYQDNQMSPLRIIDDVDIKVDVVQTSGIQRQSDLEYPDTQVSVNVTDIKSYLTKTQYDLLLHILQSFPRILASPPDDSLQLEPAQSPTLSTRDVSPVDLEPELKTSHVGKAGETWVHMDLVFSIDSIKLHLYDGEASSFEDRKEHGIARFALSGNTLRLKTLSNDAVQAQVILRSFTMTNIRPTATKFREIIPKAEHERNQFMLLYTVSSGPRPNSLVVLTVDSPKIILAIEPMIALLDFFTRITPSPSSSNAFPALPESESLDNALVRPIDFRIDLHDLSVSILENDLDADSQAIKLSVNQILLSRQEILALTVADLGMSLMRMSHPSESVRFLDDADITLTFDSRSSSLQQMTSIELSLKPIVLRASYRDIKLISAIVNKAVELYNSLQLTRSVLGTQVVTAGTSEVSRVASKHRSRLIGNARVRMVKEQLKSSCDGFRLVLIGDLQEQPMLHLKVKPFIVGAKDWSGELHATTTLSVQISYWNLTNSHWEPLIDPWTLTSTISREDPTKGTLISFSSRERLDLNLSTTFVELATTTLNMWNKEGAEVLKKPRGVYAPYRLWNRTGNRILVWADNENSTASGASPVTILHDQTVDWRFDDWKTMREHVSAASEHAIGIQFIGKPWEQLHGVPVDREGEYVFTLRPREDKLLNRLLCEVKVVDNVKVVTIRSAYKIVNQTLYPIELTLVDELGHPICSLEKISPGGDFPLPLDLAMKSRIRIQPDQGFGYKWSSALRWEEIVARKSFPIRCPHSDPDEAAFRFQAWVQCDNHQQLSKFPKITLKLSAPLELENLLPYNLRYRIYDKDTDQNWRSYLRQGGVMPVHSIELDHFVLLNVELQDTVFNPSDFAIINADANSEFDIENRLTLRDQLGRKLDLKLCYTRHADSGGAFKVQIYSPYIVINKTGLPFAIRSIRSARTGTQDAAGETQPDLLARNTPYLLSSAYENSHEYIFQFRDSTWSKIVSLEAPAADSALVIPLQKHKTDELHVGLSWSEGLGKYKLTKVITLAPRFLLKNNLPDAIVFRQHGVAPRARSILEPGERCPLLTLRAGQERLLTIAYTGLNNFWSAPINMEDIGRVHLRLRMPGAEVSDVKLIRADIKINGSMIFIILSSAENEWPFVIENESDYAIELCQKDIEEGEQVKSYPNYTAPPHSAIPYAWDCPAAKEKKILLTINRTQRLVDIMEIGNLLPFRFNDGKQSRIMSLDVRAEGHKQVLRISNYDPARSLYKPRLRSSASTISRQDTITSATEMFEAISEEVCPDFTLSVELAGIGTSLVNRRMVEVIYITLDALAFEYADSSVAQSINFTCGNMQIDNQLHDAIYPVLLQPTPIDEKSNGVAALPAVQTSVAWLKDQEHGVLFIKYCSILLQALTIEADEDLLFAVYDLTRIKGISWEDNIDDVLLQDIDMLPEPDATISGEDLYFEVLELQPIKLALSFMRTEHVSSEEKLSIRNPLAVIVNAMTMAVGNINDAPLELNALAIKDMRLTTSELQSRITYHYRQDILRQLYRVLGSADFIGNPVGLFTNVSSGVADIFYEPFHGVVMHGNRELGIGIAKGAASFVKKTVFGLSDSMTKFTSSVGKGLSAATFDSEYQARRRINQRRNRPRHAIYGVAAGGEALASSVSSAVEGIVMKPIEGAESEGALGFFKGVGKGLVGAVTKPVIGVFDLASSVSEGIRNTTTVFDNPERDRVRLPRHVTVDGVLQPYAAREALGQYWMKDLNNGLYRQESYVAHINLPGGDNVILLTASRIISFWSKKLRLEWELPLNQVQGITVEDTGIRFAHKAGRENDRFAFIPDKGSQSWFFSHIASVVKAFNAKRRMES